MLASKCTGLPTVTVPGIAFNVPDGRTFGGPPRTSSSEKSMKSAPAPPGEASCGLSSVRRTNLTLLAPAVGVRLFSRCASAGVNWPWFATVQVVPSGEVSIL